MESEHHEASMPGLELAMSNHDAAWTLSVAQTERQSPRVWMTRVTVADDGDTDLLALQTACTEMPHAPLVVAPPRLLGDWVDRLDLVDAGLAVLGQARTVTDDHELQAFCAHVLHPLRRLPVIALSNDPHSRFFGVDPRGLAEAVRGMAHVACVAPQVAASTAGRLGAEFGVASGAARIYAPGFGAGAAAAEHPLLRDGKDTGDRSVHDPGTFRRLLCQRLCAMSALRAPAGKSAQPA